MWCRVCSTTVFRLMLDSRPRQNLMRMKMMVKVYLVEVTMLFAKKKYDS